ncbi:hypothetical protein [Psychromonas ossibalaenae]|uniref:hypothetical protein n=1 Tax=Psychromonas ossibalaenae TaxID=444922 RepID=UPI00037DD3E7|nr:hypothetical protein [Psychromonas ossibalaenae]
MMLIHRALLFIGFSLLPGLATATGIPTFPDIHLQYDPLNSEGSYALPLNGNTYSRCGNDYAVSYIMSGLRGTANLMRTVHLGGQPSQKVTLNNVRGGSSVDLIIRPVGYLKYGKTNHTAHQLIGTTCSSQTTSAGKSHLWAEKAVNETTSLYVRYKPGTSRKEELTLVFEIMNTGPITPGVYGMGTYTFDIDVLGMSENTLGGNSGQTAAPLYAPIIPRLLLTVPHVFFIDFPYDAVVLNPSPSRPDQIMSGELPFYAASNEKYSITLQYGTYGGSLADNCYFDADGDLELSSSVYFPQQNVTLDLKHNKPVYVDGVQFTGKNTPSEPIKFNGGTDTYVKNTGSAAERYQGQVQFSLDISKAQPVRTYSDTIHLVFEADF